jgi:hypothetical protein
MLSTTAIVKTARPLLRDQARANMLAALWWMDL